MPISVLVLTGAGISADSGLPTFRDAGGLWEGRRPEEVATPEAWRREPELVWRFYQERRARVVAARARGARTIVQALERPENAAALDEFHAGKAAEVLPALLERWARVWAPAGGEETSP